MIRFLLGVASAAAFGAAAGCASYPAPIQQMADAEAAARSAEDTGAQSSPQAQLHLKLARDGIAQAKGLLADGDNERANYVLVRAKSDAELALAEAREDHTRLSAQRAAQKLSEMEATVGQPSSTTTTTSGVVTSPAPPAAPGTTTSTSTTTTTTTPGAKP
jgi:hypothetical protein